MALMSVNFDSDLPSYGNGLFALMLLLAELLSAKKQSTFMH